MCRTKIAVVRLGWIEETSRSTRPDNGDTKQNVDCHPGFYPKHECNASMTLLSPSCTAAGHCKDPSKEVFTAIQNQKHNFPIVLPRREGGRGLFVMCLFGVFDCNMEHSHCARDISLGIRRAHRPH